MKAQEEEAKDLVWAGKIANMASKHTDLAEEGEIFVTKRFHSNLSANLKTDEIGWESVLRLKGNSFFEGFAKQNFYLDCMNEEVSENQKEFEVVKTMFSFDSTGDLNVNDIINSIVQGTKQQTEAMMQRFETVVRREVAIEERERKLQIKDGEIELQEKRLKEQQQSLDAMRSSEVREIEFKKTEVEFNIRAKFLSDNLKTFEFEKALEEIKYLIELGDKIGKTHLDLKSNKLYYWRLVPYTKKFNLNIAYNLIEEWFSSFPIANGGMPWDSDIIDVVRRIDKKVEFYELIKQNIKLFSPNAEGLKKARNILNQLGFQDRFEHYEQKFIE
ncbi:hypothetical protein ACQKNX_20145 [Lysinibacillus sp. NPDC093712]|uniref:hypothetical protein n=1 Tax=Lysinibacillus sp. NPDC093712 TaxID=3390579 RepID=UPI003D046210